MNLLEQIMEIQEKQRQEAPKMDPEVALAECAEEFRGFLTGAKNPFKVGDIVTVKRNTVYAGAGEVHVVVEASNTEIPCLTRSANDTGNPGTAYRYDTRVITYATGRSGSMDTASVVSYYMPSCALEPMEVNGIKSIYDV